MRAEWMAIGDPVADAAAVRAKVPSGADVSAAVAEIVARVRAEGDPAVREYTRRFDLAAAAPAADAALQVDPGELQAALAALPADVRAGLELARRNIDRVAAAGRAQDVQVTLEQGHTVLLREVPVERAGVYVPGGRAPYPSSVLMGAATARAAGVAEVAFCAPPGPDGRPHPVILAACALAGVQEVHLMGGAQAIAALAYGTQTIRPVDVIVGPGNRYVQEAKRQVFGQVGIDGFAGPSDVVVVAGGAGAEPAHIALDLLAQAEHGDDTLVVVVSADERLLDDVGVELGTRVAARPTVADALCVLAHAADMEAALAFSEALAPEHLQLTGAAAERLAPRVRRAGALFVGATGATAFGDYVAGSNHVLPTEGAARFASGLSVRHFTRRMAEVRIGAQAAAPLAAAGAAIARAEGFAVHAESMEARVGAAAPAPVREDGAP